MKKQKDPHLFIKMALIILIATVVSSLAVQYQNCKYVGGTLVRGLFMMECIK